MPVIRPYEETDAPTLCRLVKDWGTPRDLGEAEFRSSVNQLLSHPGLAILLAIEENRVVGYAQTMQCHELLFEPYLEVAQILVAKDSRGKGIGRALMGAVETAAREAGFTMVKLSSQLFRSKTHVFYEGLGYECFKMSKFYQKELSTLD